MDELEQRVKHMDDEMRRLNRSEASLEQSNQVSKLHQAPTARTLNPVPNHPEPGSEREEILSINVSSPDDESSRADLETSDQPSCVLRAQDGKMRFFGGFIIFLWIQELTRSSRGVFRVLYAWCSSVQKPDGKKGRLGLA